MQWVTYLGSIYRRMLRGKPKPDTQARLKMPPPAPWGKEAPRSVLPRPPGAPARANFGTLKRRPFGRNRLRR